MKKHILIWAMLSMVLLSLAACTTDVPDDEGSCSHQFEKQVVEPSCTDGYTIYTCTKCTYSYTDDYTDALGHRFEERIEDVVCTEKKNKVFTCLVCKYSYSEKTEEQGSLHQYEARVTEPTMQEGGYTEYICKLCSFSYKDEPTDPINYSRGLKYQKDGAQNHYFVVGIGSCTDSEIVIPAVNEHGQTVRGIKTGGISSDKITAVTVLEGVVEIEAQAFKGARIQKIVLPDSAFVKTGAFYDLPALEEITMHFEPTYGYSEFFLAEQSIRYVGVRGEIGEGTFTGNSTIREVKVHEGVTVIRSSAFADCTALETLTLPKSLEKIGLNAFKGTALKSLTIPSGVKNLTDGHAFEDCTSLKELTVEEGVTTLNGFGGCTALEKVTLPSTLKILGDAVFANCTALKSLTLPSGVEQIESYAFSGCTALTQINFPEGLRTIGFEAFSSTSLNIFGAPSSLTEIYRGFYGCEKLEKADLSAATGLTSLGRSAFQGCKALTSVKLPATLKKLENYAFSDCESLVFLDLGKNLTEIGGYAFAGCENLTAPTLYESLLKIGNRAFKDCKKVRYESLPKSLTMLDSYAFEGSSVGTVYYTPKMEAGASIAGSNVEKLVVEEGVTDLRHAFASNCAALKSVELPSTLKTIEVGVFNSCTSLKQITLPEGLEEIAESAFSKSGIGAVTLPKSLKKLGASAFSCCADLKTITFSSADIEIGERAFENTAIVEISIPQGKTKIEPEAFFKMPALEKVSLPKSIQIVESGAFFGCTSLSDVNFNNAKVVLESKAFFDCTALKSIKNLTVTDCVYDAVSGTGLIKKKDGMSYAFGFLFKGEDQGLKAEVVIPAEITSICDGAFANCGKPVTITMHDGVRSVGKGVFAGCVDLEKVVFSEGLTVLDQTAFEGCVSLKEVHFSKNLTKIEEGAFDQKTHKNLERIVYEGTMAEWGSVLGSDHMLVRSFDVYCADGVCGGYLVYGALTNGKSYLLTQDGTLTFSGAGQIDVFPSHLLKDYADLVKRLVFEEGITGVADVYNVHLDYPGIAEIVVPSTMKNLPKNKFKSTKWYKAFNEDPRGVLLTEDTLLAVSTSYSGAFVLPQTVKTVADGAFADCTAITTIDLGSVKKLGGGSISGCSSLKSLILPDSLTELGYRAISNCPLIEELTVPAGVTLVNTSIADCDGLKKLTVCVKQDLNDVIVSGCKELKTVIFQKGITKISGCITDCPALSLVVLPETVSYVSPYSFGKVAVACMTEKTANAVTVNNPQATVYLYSEKAPQTEGNFWHYDAKGEIVFYS